MSNHPELAQIADQFTQNGTLIRQIASGLAQIAKAMESGALSGTPTDQQMPDVLRDRQMLNMVQMSDKLLELGAELKLLAKGSTASQSRYAQPLTEVEAGSLNGYALDDMFALFVPYLPPELVSPDALKALRHLLAQFPDSLSRSLLLEHRLRADEPQVDISILLDPALDQGREVLGGRLPVTLQEHWAWQRLQRFCQGWADPASPLYAALESCWLEFDVPLDHLDALPPFYVPSPFFRLKDKDLAPELALQALRAGLDILGPDPASLAQVGRCLDLLPADGKVRWAGVMLSRAAHHVRLCLDLPPAGIRPYLLALGWGGNEEQVDLLVTGFTKLTDLLVLAIELTPEGVLPTIGFECRYKFNRQPEIEPRWKWLMDTLVKAQLCAPEKAAPLLRWNGLHYRQTPHLAVPQVLVRNQSHIKLQFEPGVAVTAKAYTTCNWRDFKLATRGQKR